jgi:hypothetical protein
MLTLLSGASVLGAVFAATRLLRGTALLVLAGIVLAAGLGLLGVGVALAPRLSFAIADSLLRVLFSAVLAGN